MITINIIYIGKKFEKYTNLGIEKFISKLANYCSLKFYKISPITNFAIEKNLAKETKEIQKYLKKGLNFICDGNGKNFSSLEFSKVIEKVTLKTSIINFVIGSSHGLSDEIKRNNYLQISFSKMTFPHELFQVILLEQIYRSFTIINNRNYHK